MNIRSFISLWLSDRYYYELMFRKHQGYFLDWNKVETLNEKIQYLKRYQRDPIQRMLADKYDVRAFVESELGDSYLIPVKYCSGDVMSIPWKQLEFPYIVKSTHGSGHFRVIRDASDLDVCRLNKLCSEWLDVDYYRVSREWQYSNLRPRIIIEHLLEPSDGSELKDYKFHCIGGKVYAIQVDLDRSSNHRRNFYSTDWDLLPFEWSIYKKGGLLWPNGAFVERPDCLDELVVLSERLSSCFKYVRIDWYVLGSRAYFGEITFHHGSGFERILPRSYDLFLGSKVKLR